MEIKSYGIGGFFAGTKEKGSWVGMGTQAAKYGALGAAAGSFIPLETPSVEESGLPWE